VGEVLDGAVVRYGPHFAEVLATAKVWVDGEPAERSLVLAYFRDPKARQAAAVTEAQDHNSFGPLPLHMAVGRRGDRT